MKLKDMSKEELETMGYDEIAYLVLEESGKKMKLLDLFKKVCKSNGIAWSTYLVGATMIGLGANLAVKVRDKIAQPKSVF